MSSNSPTAADLKACTAEDLFAEIRRRGMFIELDGAIGSLYDHLDRSGALDSQDGLTEFLAKRVRLQAAKLLELQGFAGAAEPWAQALAAMDGDVGNDDLAQTPSGPASESRYPVVISWSIDDTETIADVDELQDEPDALVQRVRLMLWCEIGLPYGDLYDTCAKAGNEFIDRVFAQRADRLITEARKELLAEHRVRVSEDDDQPGRYGWLWMNERGGHRDGRIASFSSEQAAVAAAWERFKDELFPQNPTHTDADDRGQSPRGA